ncbi:Conserved hypothetical protein [Micromonospora lupini str. Lupac 08]|uniref:Uncharacterized protein n=1 Tax=Micromonospora lupini str. Lupac 08 TaxID=1150864 RepID=I0KYK1_9ACTN|nr:Conserved hypothetical protein [Micromonospora lupini str. Lupac 08]
MVLAGWLIAADPGTATVRIAIPPGTYSFGGVTAGRIGSLAGVHRRLQRAAGLLASVVGGGLGGLGLGLVRHGGAPSRVRATGTRRPSRAVVLSAPRRSGVTGAAGWAA